LYSPLAYKLRYGDFMTCKKCRRRRALRKQKQLEDGMGARDEKTA
jgi:hypothetical protein